MNQRIEEATAAYKLILEGLQRETATLDVRLGAAQRLAELSRDEANANAAPALFVVIAPAVIDSVLLLTKLAEDKGERSLPKLLRVARGRRTDIAWKILPTDKAICDQEELLGGHANATSKLKTLRDKALAHHDKEYFDSPEAFRDTVAFATEEIAEVLRTIQHILSDHATWIGSGSAVSFAGFAYAHVDEMVRRLRDTRR